MTEHAKNWIDAASIGVAAGTLFQLLPALAALASLVWTGIRIYEYLKGKRNGNKRLDGLDS